MALSVDEILGIDLADPVFAYNPSQASPLGTEVDWEDGTPRSGGTWERSPQGIYRRVGDGVVPINGNKQRLLVQAGQVTQALGNSSNPSVWNESAGGIVGSTSREPLLTSNSHAVEPRVLYSDTSGSDSIFKQNGTFTANPEAYWSFVEHWSAERLRIRMQETGGYNTVAFIEVDLHQDDNNAPEVISSSGNVPDSFVRKVAEFGPNGGPVYLIKGAYNPGSQGVDGNGRRFTFYPDRDGNGDGTILHHAQAETRSPAGAIGRSGPIVSGGGSITRNEGVFKINVGDWWPKNELTILMKMRLLSWTPKNTYSNNFVSVLSYNDLSTNISIRNNGPANLNFKSEDDSGNSTPVRAHSGFEDITIAFSATPNEQKFASNGTGGKANHDGSWFNTPSPLFIGNTLEHAEIDYLRILPQALTVEQLESIT